MRHHATSSGIKIASMATSPRAEFALWTYRQAHRPSIALGERFCRTVDRINPARVCGSHHRLGRGAFAPDLASLCPLLQQHQDASVIEQRCAGLSSHSTDREHHVTSDPRWASSPLRSDLGFSVHTPIGARKEAFVKDVADAWARHGEAMLDRMATIEPSGFAERW